MPLYKKADYVITELCLLTLQQVILSSEDSQTTHIASWGL